ncbi:hypothetical protein GWK47_036818 [Chionoecetes opilio]|uniref:Uncharacterized protein n=1 Tax=Chionoecetes opilio TaxID=41210 RepID=A0A8J4YM69_CHIOP|nr:hypothetical protein GWK47_036818 [Chionoecetes opilio]
MTGEGQSRVKLHPKDGDGSLKGSDLPSSRMSGAGRLVMSCLREISRAWVFVRGQADLPSTTPGDDVVQCQIDVAHRVLPVTSVTGEGKGAVISVGLGLRNELENVIEIDIPQKRPEYAALRDAGVDGLLAGSVAVDHHP